MAAKHVLAVDDENHIRRLVEVNLQRAGYRVSGACDGVEAFERIRAERPDLVVLDVMMPRMDGWAVLSALKADPDLAEIPVIMVSMIRETGLAYSLGAADYLTKPVDWQRLKETVDRHRLPSATPAGLALVVESDAATREELGHLLAGEGWEVAGAADADAERGRARHERKSLVYWVSWRIEAHSTTGVAEPRSSSGRDDAASAAARIAGSRAARVRWPSVWPRGTSLTAADTRLAASACR